MAGVLTEAQIDHFVRNAYVVVEDCFSADTAARWVGDALARAKIDATDPATWPSPHAFLGQIGGVQRNEDVATFSPKLWEAICQLVGGAERIDLPYQVNDGFVMNFCAGAEQPTYVPPGPGPGWHVDGDFAHFLDSPEAGLFVLTLWTDIGPQGGATWIAPDSIGPIARALIDAPQGLSAKELRIDNDFSQQCSRFMGAEGRAGTAYLMHPLMLHAVSPNRVRKPRAIRNGFVQLKEPMRFDRDDPADLSPVERCTLHALGIDRLTLPPVDPDLRRVTDHDTGERQGPTAWARRASEGRLRQAS